MQEFYETVQTAIFESMLRYESYLVLFGINALHFGLELPVFVFLDWATGMWTGWHMRCSGYTCNARSVLKWGVCFTCADNSEPEVETGMAQPQVLDE